MKKNLISAVAAGLALALAITSFGCESGSNDPVAIQAATAYTNGNKFTYEVFPTEYTYNGENVANTSTTYTDGRVHYFGTSYDAGWTKNSYINGVNAFNRNTGAVLGEIEKKAQFVSPVLGNYCATKKQTVVLDAKAQTITWTQDTTTYQVVGLRLHSGSYDFATRQTADANKSLVYITLPYSVILDAPGAGTHTTDTAWAGTAATGYLNQYALPNNRTELEVLKSAVDQVVDGTKIAFNGVDYDLKELADAYYRGARFFVEGNGKRVYYKSLAGDLNGEDDNTNTNFVKKVNATTDATGTEKGKGKYKLSGDYTNGTVTVVAWGDETFREDGYYYKANVLQINKADVDHPQATAYNVTNPKTGDKLFSANRTLTIASGVLSSPRYYEGYSTTYTGRLDKNGFFFESSLPTYARAKTFATDNTTRTDTSKEGFQFSLKKSE